MATMGFALLAAARDDRGTVTAEFAAALPAVLFVLVLAVSSLQAGALQLRVTDAAASAARISARGDPSTADGLVARLVGDHQLSTTEDGGYLCAVVSAPIRLGGFAAGDLRASARSCALAEGQ